MVVVGAAVSGTSLLGRTTYFTDHDAIVVAVAVITAT